jgi:Zn-dependent peptidase ImmA (M78 family)
LDLAIALEHTRHAMWVARILRPPTNLRALAFSLGAAVHVFSLEGESEKLHAPDGFLTRIGGQPTICVKKDMPHARRRFTVAHEIGHIILQTPGTPLKDAPVDSEYWGRDERETNCVAAEILMPEATVRELWGQNIRERKALRNIFLVSDMAMKRTLADLGLSP